MMLRHPILYLQNTSSRRILNVKSYQFSTVAKKTIDSIFEKHINDLEGLSTVYPKNRVKLPQKPPFVKNLFLAKFDTDILTYPQLQKADVDELENVVGNLQKLSSLQDKNINIKEVLQILHSARCLGLQCPINEGGRELNQTEQCRYSEILLDNKFKFSLLNNELCIIALSKFGTDDQKNKYLNKLLDGSISATICLSENSVGNSKNISKTIASLSEDFKTYTLNGKKMYNIGGSDSELFIVFSQLDESVEGSQHELDLTAFLVERKSPGVTIEKNEIVDENLRGTANLIFNNTPVSIENMFGEDRRGKQMLSILLPEYHLSSSVIGLNIIKKMSSFLAKDHLDKSTPTEQIYQTEAVTSKLGEVLTYAYAVESMIYLTSGLMSTYEKQDCEVEALVTRIMSSTLALKSTTIGFSMSGTPSVESRHICQELNQEALSLFTSYEHENMSRLLVALLGLQYAGKELGEVVKKLRNPMFNPSFIMKRLWQDRAQQDDQPKLTLGLKNYLHLSLQEAADQLEYCVFRLQFATETLFARYGIDILNKHCHLRRLAEATIQIYIMTACLGRASRSYCIGLKNCNLELSMANVICKNCLDVAKKNMNEIIYESKNVDPCWGLLTDNLFKEREYYFAHPLNRNF